MDRIIIFDCGCVPSRPKEQSCNTYGTRWRAYITPTMVMLRCRDCGKRYNFKINRLESINYMNKEELL